MNQGLTVVKIVELLARKERWCRSARRTAATLSAPITLGRGDTLPVLGGEPGTKCQIDFARMGIIVDAEWGGGG